jgi:Annexin
MGSMYSDTRCKVPVRYGTMFDGDGETLMKLMKSECGKKDFGTALQFLALDPISAEAHMIRKAIAGFGTNELLLYSIVVGRSNQEITILKKKYFDIFTKDLGSALDNDLGRSFEALILNCLQANEEEYDPDGKHNNAQLEDDCEKLYKMAEGKFGTNEKGLFKLLCESPGQYMKQLSLLYAEKHGYTIPKVLENEMGGQLRGAALHLVGMKLKPYETIAGLIEKACAKKLGTNELLLTCTLIRYQRVLPQVDTAHIEAYGKSIKDRVQSEVGGLYRKLLLEILAVGMGE